ncbi:hypothetical protein HK097_004119, partial [Rhizophlyctis rosea]
MSRRQAGSAYPDSVATTTPGSATPSVAGHSDTEGYIRYLLQGSGTEDKVDFAALRRELDTSQSPSISNILSGGSKSEEDAFGASRQDVTQESFFARIAKEVGSTPIVRGRSKPLQKKTSVQRLPPPDPQSEEISESTPDEHVAHRERSDGLHTESLRSAPAATRTTKARKDHEDQSASESHRKTPSPKRSAGKGKQGDERTPETTPPETSPEDSGTTGSTVPEVRHSRHLSRPKLPEVSPNTDIHPGPSFCPSFTPEEVPLQELSTALTNAGFPPLHPTILFAPIDHVSFKLPLTARQVDSIKSVLSALLAEVERRGETLQSLLVRVTEAEEQRHRVQDRAQQAAAARIELATVEAKTVDELQKALQDAMAQTAKLTGDLAGSRAETSDLRSRYAQLKRAAEDDKKEIERLKMEMSELVDKTEKARIRNERTFAIITGQYKRNPQRSGVDRLTLEVVEVYEDKLERAQREIAQLREQLRKRPHQSHTPTTSMNAQHSRAASSSSARSSGPSQVSDRGAVELDDEMAIRNRATGYDDVDGDDGDRLARLRRAMGQQINGLQARLQATTIALRESQKETDLVKLQLLATKKADWLARKKDRAQRLNTRDLIRRDKKAWKLKLYKIDAMSLEECQDLLKDVCVKLEINDIEKLDPALDALETVIKLIPQMEEFIVQVDEAVWYHQNRLINEEDQDTENSRRRVPDRLGETLDVVRGWSRSMAEVEVLKDFRSRVYVLLRREERRGGDEVLFEELR